MFEISTLNTLHSALNRQFSNHCNILLILQQRIPQIIAIHSLNHCNISHKWVYTIHCFAILLNSVASRCTLLLLMIHVTITSPKCESSHNKKTERGKEQKLFIVGCSHDIGKSMQECKFQEFDCYLSCSSLQLYAACNPRTCG